MITMVLGPLTMGLLRFSPHGRKVKMKWRWHEVERIGGYPGLQFLGKGLKTMSLNGTLLLECSPSDRTRGGLNISSDVLSG